MPKRIFSIILNHLGITLRIHKPYIVNQALSKKSPNPDSRFSPLFAINSQEKINYVASPRGRLNYAAFSPFTPNKFHVCFFRYNQTSTVPAHILNRTTVFRWNFSLKKFTRFMLRSKQITRTGLFSISKKFAFAEKGN